MCTEAAFTNIYGFRSVESNLIGAGSAQAEHIIQNYTTDTVINIYFITIAITKISLNSKNKYEVCTQQFNGN